MIQRNLVTGINRNQHNSAKAFEPGKMSKVSISFSGFVSTEGRFLSTINYIQYKTGYGVVF